MSAGLAHSSLSSLAEAARLRAELARAVGRWVSGPDVEDVVQEALLRAHLSLASLRQPERLGPWLHRIARNAAVDHLRRQQPTGPIEEEPLASEPEAEAEELRSALASCLAPLLQRLPAAQAEALRQTELAGRSQAELARALDLPLPTVKARVQRGRRRLREELEACCALAQDARGVVVEAQPRDPGEACGLGCGPSGRGGVSACAGG